MQEPTDEAAPEEPGSTPEIKPLQFWKASGRATVGWPAEMRAPMVRVDEVNNVGQGAVTCSTVDGGRFVIAACAFRRAYKPTPFWLHVRVGAVALFDGDKCKMKVGACTALQRVSAIATLSEEVAERITYVSEQDKVIRGIKAARKPLPKITDYGVTSSRGDTLDAVAAMHGLARRVAEPDDMLIRRVQHQRTTMAVALGEALKPIDPTEAANFVVCAGGCGKELVLPVGALWTCSVECWGKAIAPQPPIKRPCHPGIIGPGDLFLSAAGEHVTVLCGGEVIHFASYDGRHTGAYSPETFFEAYPTRVHGAATADRIWCTDCGRLVQVSPRDVKDGREQKCCPDHWRQRLRAQAAVASLLTEEDLVGRPE